MSELTKRSIFGLIYGVAVIGSLLWCQYAFDAIMLVMIAMGIREFLILQNTPKKLKITTIIIAVVLFVAITITKYVSIIEPKQTFRLIMDAGLICLFIFVLLAIDFIYFIATMKYDNPTKNWGDILISQLWILLPFVLMSLCAYNESSRYMLLMTFITVWINDTFAYFIGVLTAKRKNGNHKMAPRLSPKKSWEGLVGGLIPSMALGCLFVAIGWGGKIELNDENTMSYVIMSGITLLIAVMAVLGDLVESAVKRAAGVKDSGVFLPGHGGVLDRFDSMLVATPVSFGILYLIYLFINI